MLKKCTEDSFRRFLPNNFPNARWDRIIICKIYMCMYVFLWMRVCKYVLLVSSFFSKAGKYKQHTHKYFTEFKGEFWFMNYNLYLHVIMVAPSKLSNVFTYESWVHAVSGAAGGCIAMSVFYPLDTVRSRLQLEDPDRKGEARSTVKVIKEIVLGEGFQCLYRGLGPVLQSLCISNFVYFYTFHSLKALASGKDKKAQTALNDLLLGAIAGIVNVLMTTPFWVVNTRCRMRNVSGTSDEVNKYYKSLVSGLVYVAKTEGIKGLWSGTIPSLILVSNPSLQFMMYELLKRNLIKYSGKDKEISSLGYFLIGAGAKAFATILTYPIQLVQTKLRHQPKHNTDPSTSKQAAVADKIGVIQMILDIIKYHGFRGLFRGMEAKILQTVLTAALMFMAYEKINNTVFLLLKKPPNKLIQ